MATAPDMNVNLSQLGESVKRLFADRANIDAIFLLDAGRYIRVIIVTNEERYDRDAFNDLFEAEYKLLDEYPDLMLDVDYISRMGRGLDRIAPAGSIPIFRR